MKILEDQIVWGNLPVPQDQLWSLSSDWQIIGKGPLLGAVQMHNSLPSDICQTPLLPTYCKDLSVQQCMTHPFPNWAAEVQRLIQWCEVAEAQESLGCQTMHIGSDTGWYLSFTQNRPNKINEHEVSAINFRSTLNKMLWMPKKSKNTVKLNN